MKTTDGNGKVLKTLHAKDLTVDRSLVGAVRAHDVEITRAAAGPIMASGRVSIHQGGCGPVLTGGDLSIHQGGCGPVLAKGNVSIEQGGCQSILSVGRATLGSGAFVGVVAAPRATIEDGARVLMTVKQAAAFGAALGLVFGLIVRRLGRA